MVTVCTLNLGDGPDAKKLDGLERLAAKGVDVIALQECGDRQGMLNTFCTRYGWQMWAGDGSPGAASVPILWNPQTMRARRTGTTKATKATRVGSRGAGPSTMKAKTWNRVRFAGGLLVINGHIVPSVYLPTRRRLAKQQIGVLARMVRKRRKQVHNGLRIVAVGDFNMKPDNGLLNPLRRLGMQQHTKAPTHGRRTIDLMWTLGIKHADSEVINAPSDHRAALIHLREK